MTSVSKWFLDANFESKFIKFRFCRIHFKFASNFTISFNSIYFFVPFIGIRLISDNFICANKLGLVKYLPKFWFDKELTINLSHPPLYSSKLIFEILSWPQVINVVVSTILTTSWNVCEQFTPVEMRFKYEASFIKVLDT